ncbi:MAG TPA: chemotaxis protein CheW [Gemmatimonadaceae bacterium]|jgi:purine-binding chemotaxis protein CheW|nr:chemotaxis protein CheW [Gemmatimonadaceae bacterium]
MTATATSQQIVTFRVGEDRFAADIFAVERVLRYQQPTVVPNLPEWIEGVIDYANRVVPVIDFRRRLGLPRIEPRPETRIIVFALGDGWAAAVVDAVHEVTSVSAEQISPPPALFRGLSAEYLRGLVRSGDRLVLFVEMDRLLTTTERITLERVSTESPSA